MSLKPLKPLKFVSILTLSVMLFSCGGGTINIDLGGGDDDTLPAKVVGGYYPNWTLSPVRIRDVDTHYNVIYLFHGQPVGGRRLTRHDGRGVFQPAG